MADDRPPARDAARPWTRIDEYIVSLARRRSARRAHSLKPRTQPEEPRFFLTTLPFLLLMAALLVIAVGIVIAAWPGSQPEPQPKLEVDERGVAKRGWLEDAEREFH